MYNEGDYLLLTDGRTVLVTDVPQGNEDAPENLLVVEGYVGNDRRLFVINPFQVDKNLGRE